MLQRQIDKAINEEIIQAINLYLDTYGDGNVASDRLDEEWKSLSKINDMLSVLKEATKSLEGHVVSLTNRLSAINLILTKFEDGRAQYKNDIVTAPLYPG